MKKIISCILAVLVMVSALSLNSYAVAVDTTVTDLRSISDPDLFYELFPEKGIRTLANSEPSVRYTVEYSADNAEETTVNLHFTLCDGGALYNANVVGVVEKTELSNGTYYISGPLDGTIIGADGTTHEIVVGFQSESGSDCISAGVTVNAKDEYLFFAFGQYEMPNEIYSEYQKLDGSPYTMNVNANEAVTSTNAADAYVCRGTHSLSGGNETLGLYYNPYWQTIAATVRSDSEKVKKDSFFSTSRVYSGKIEFETYKKDEECHVFFDRFSHIPNSGTTPIGNYLNTILIELFTKSVPLPFAWNVIDAVSSSIQGSIERNPVGMSGTQTLAYVNAKVSSGNFDQAPLAAAVTMGVDSNLTYTCHLKTTASIRYVCTHIKEIYYVNSQSMYVETDLTVTGYPAN